LPCYLSAELSTLNISMTQMKLHMLQAQLIELETAYRAEPNPDLLTQIFQLQVAIQQQQQQLQSP